MISGPRTPAVGRFSKVRRFLRLRPTLQDFSPPTSTESLPPIIHATPTDYFPYVLPLARGLSQQVSGQRSEGSKGSSSPGRFPPNRSPFPRAHIAGCLD